MPEPFLDCAQVNATFGQGITARMSQAVRVQVGKSRRSAGSTDVLALTFAQLPVGQQKGSAATRGRRSHPTPRVHFTAPINAFSGLPLLLRFCSRLPSISARWWRSVVFLRSIVIGAAKRAPEKATAPLGLGIIIVGLYQPGPPDRNGVPPASRPYTRRPE